MSRNIRIIIAAILVVAVFTLSLAMTLKGAVNQQGAALTALQTTVNQQGAALTALQTTVTEQGEVLELLQGQLGDVEHHNAMQAMVLERHNKRIKALESFARRKACKGSRSASCKR